MLLFVGCCLRFVDCVGCCWLIVRSWLFVICFVVYVVSFGDCSLLFVVCRLFLVVGVCCSLCDLFVVRCSLCVVRYALFVVCCMLCVVCFVSLVFFLSLVVC